MASRSSTFVPADAVRIRPPEPPLVHEAPPPTATAHGVSRYARRLWTKRALDLALLIPAAIFALPVVMLLALLVAIVSPGNPFYAQRREGYGGRPIRVWKIRTMRRDADRILEDHLATDPHARAEWGSRFKLTHDPRILPGIGPVLRRTSLDEVPQLWNIARGEMSFVGPRPFPHYHLDAFDADFRVLRRSVLPGLTGPWQISERAEGDLSVQEQWDRRYVEEWSLAKDVEILLRTPLAVIRGKGAY